MKSLVLCFYLIAGLALIPGLAFADQFGATVASPDGDRVKSCRITIGSSGGHTYEYYSCGESFVTCSADGCSVAPSGTSGGNLPLVRPEIKLRANSSPVEAAKEAAAIKETEKKSRN